MLENWICMLYLFNCLPHYYMLDVVWYYYDYTPAVRLVYWRITHERLVNYINLLHRKVRHCCQLLHDHYRMYSHGYYLHVINYLVTLEYHIQNFLRSFTCVYVYMYIHPYICLVTQYTVNAWDQNMSSNGGQNDNFYLKIASFA